MTEISATPEKALALLVHDHSEHSLWTISARSTGLLVIRFGTKHGAECISIAHQFAEAHFCVTLPGH